MDPDNSRAVVKFCFCKLAEADYELFQQSEITFHKHVETADGKYLAWWTNLISKTNFHLPKKCSFCNVNKSFQIQISVINSCVC